MTNKEMRPSKGSQLDLLSDTGVVRSSRLPPIVKWAGGKTRELRYILPALPDNFDIYYEPFIGGGAVFFSVDFGHAHINDKSSELMDLYSLVKEQDPVFFASASEIAEKWNLIGQFTSEHSQDLVVAFRKLESNQGAGQLATEYSEEFAASHSAELYQWLPDFVLVDQNSFLGTLSSTLSSKMVRTNRIQAENGRFSDNELLSNLESALRSAFYVQLRTAYNQASEHGLTDRGRTAVFYFIREFCYASMFRYSKEGHFNVPYGGLQYNRKDFGSKIRTLASDEYAQHIGRAKLSNLDFMEFLELNPPSPDDFVFLDPPYDSDFSTYALNSFTTDDHRRLASYLANECKARFLLVIKETELITELYDWPSLNVMAFDRMYGVSFMDRNERRTTHMLITNY